jgi:hypothetical protein
VLNFDIDSANLIFGGKKRAVALFYRQENIEEVKQFEALVPRIDRE